MNISSNIFMLFGLLFILLGMLVLTAPSRVSLPAQEGGYAFVACTPLHSPVVIIVFVPNKQPLDLRNTGYEIMGNKGLTDREITATLPNAPGLRNPLRVNNPL